MLNYISADCVYPVTSNPIQNGIIGVEDDGTIAELLTVQEAAQKGINSITHYNGLLVPGFINTHCHLELSHLKGKIEKNTGLPAFVEQIIKTRKTDDSEIILALTEADAAMYEAGISAVADISNQLISRQVKLGSHIYYHTFVEAMGFNPSRAADIMKAAVLLKNDFSPLSASVIPHAPYSVSAELFKEIADYGLTIENLGSIHNQETEEEDFFFKDKKGHFLKLYDFLGLDISFYQASGKSSLQTILPALSAQKMLLVHNTYSLLEDVSYANTIHKNLYWCLCPNANLYIEGRLPDVKMLMDAGVTLTLGTDSLASNDRLSILDEMKTLQQLHQLKFSDLLEWATINGATFLGIDQQFGSFEYLKKPGINLIEQANDEVISDETTIRRLY
jgi:cytosine/adenosine deaminase-related metal-dependent hydrolase